MGKIYIILVFMAILRLEVSAQDTLAAWTFPTGTAADSIANIASTANLFASISTEGGTSAIDWSKNGFTGKAAQATGWDNGANSKAWIVSFSSQGYQGLTISSRMQSGGNNPGPAGYKVQYAVNAVQGWVDVPGGIVTTANDWTTAYVNALAIPSDIDNQPQTVYLRWLQTTDSSSNGGTVIATGTNKIDEVYITGTQINIGIEQQATVTPRISSFPGGIRLFGISDCSLIRLYDISGRVVYSGTESRIGGLKRGVYIVVVNRNNEITLRQKLIIE